MKYVYKMVQVPPNVTANKKNVATAAADYLQNVVNEWAENDWEFYRIDDFSTAEPQGCLSGGKFTYTTYKVITFRKEQQ